MSEQTFAREMAERFGEQLVTALKYQLQHQRGGEFIHNELGLDNLARLMAHFGRLALAAPGARVDPLMPEPDLVNEAIQEIEWWAREHGCCRGKSDELLKRLRASRAGAGEEASPQVSICAQCGHRRDGVGDLCHEEGCRCVCGEDEAAPRVDLT